jgi:hypothetical protein
MSKGSANQQKSYYGNFRVTHTYPVAAKSVGFRLNKEEAVKLAHRLMSAAVAEEHDIHVVAYYHKGGSVLRANWTQKPVPANSSEPPEEEGEAA